MDYKRFDNLIHRSKIQVLINNLKKEAMSIEEISKLLNVHRATTYYYVNTLRDKNMIIKRKNGRKVIIGLKLKFRK